MLLSFIGIKSESIIIGKIVIETTTVIYKINNEISIFLERICLVTQEIIIQIIKAIIPAKNATGISKVLKAPLNTSSINLKQH